AEPGTSRNTRALRAAAEGDHRPKDLITSRPARDRLESDTGETSGRTTRPSATDGDPPLSSDHMAGWSDPSPTGLTSSARISAPAPLGREGASEGVAGIEWWPGRGSGARRARGFRQERPRGQQAASGARAGAEAGGVPYHAPRRRQPPRSARPSRGPARRRHVRALPRRLQPRSP